MTAAPPNVTLPDCGYDPPSSKRVLGLSKQATEVHPPVPFVGECVMLVAGACTAFYYACEGSDAEAGWF